MKVLSLNLGCNLFWFHKNKLAWAFQTVAVRAINIQAVLAKLPEMLKTNFMLVLSIPEMMTFHFLLNYSTLTLFTWFGLSVVKSIY